MMSRGDRHLTDEAAAMADSWDVIVVDDEDVARLITQVQLEELGHRVRTAVSAEEGLAVARSSPPDAVVTDRRLSGMDGADLARAIRSEPPPLGDAAVVGLSASDTPEDRHACLSAGMDSYLVKPVEATDLAAAISAALLSRRQPGSATVVGATTRATDPGIGAVLARIERDIGRRGPVVVAVRSFIDSLGGWLDEILGDGDAADRSRAAHTLKGAALTLGAGRLADVAQRLESAPDDLAPRTELRVEARMARQVFESYIRDDGAS